MLTAKLARLARDVALVPGLMVQQTPFLVVELGAGAEALMPHRYAALAERKAREITSGNRVNASAAATAGRGVQVTEADLFAANVVPANAPGARVQSGTPRTGH